MVVLHWKQATSCDTLFISVSTVDYSSAVPI